LSGLPPSLPAPTASATVAATATAPISPTASATSTAPLAPTFVTLDVGGRDDLAGVTFVVGEGSEVTFTVTEQLSRLPLPNDAVIRTSALSGSIYLDGRASVVEIDLQRLSSDQSRRDQYIRTRMFASSPIATLTIDALPPLPDSYTPGELFTGEVTGSLLILGVVQSLTFSIEVRLDPDALFVLARTTFTWEEIGVPRPSVPTVQVQDEVRVEVLIAARPTLDAAS
jgi:polyisoprenoid-binding protein YceI